MKKYISFLAISIFGLVGFAYAQTVSGNLGATQQDAYVSTFCSYVNSPIPYGARNESVRHLQNILRTQYQYNVSPTGYFGPVTFNIIKSLQRTMSISFPTGSLGPVTLGKMRAVWCQGANPGNPSTNGQPIISLNPISSSGNIVTVGWNVQNAASCTLNSNSVNNVSGTQAFTIYSETNYTMSCSSYNGQTSQATIAVKPNSTNSSLQPAVSIYASPSTFAVGQSVMIVWNSTNATTCTLNGQSVATSGAQQVTIGANNSYTVSCSGNGYTASQTLTASGVTTSCPAGTSLVNGQCVNQTVCTMEMRYCSNGQPMQRDANCTWRTDLCATTAAQPIINSFTANSGSFYWSVTGATACTINGNGMNNVSVGTGGTYIPTGTYVYSGSYTLACSNGYSQVVSRTATVASTTTNQGTVQINTTSAAVGSTYQVSWTAPSAYSSEAQGVIVDLVDANTGSVVGTIGRYSASNMANYLNGNVAWIVPVAIQDSRNDGIRCQIVNGQNVCGNLIKAGSYKIAVTYFTPSNACFGFCPQVVGQKTLGVVNSSNFTITNSIADTSAYNNYWNQFVLKYSDLSGYVKLYENYLSGESDFGWSKLLTYNIISNINNLDTYNSSARNYIAQYGNLYSSYELTNDTNADANRVIVNLFTLKDTSRQYYEVSIEKLYIKNNQVYRVLYAEKVPFSNSITESSQINTIYAKYMSQDFKNSFLYTKFNF